VNLQKIGNKWLRDWKKKKKSVLENLTKMTRLRGFGSVLMSFV
jgi:hypothetical protein